MQRLPHRAKRISRVVKIPFFTTLLAAENVRWWIALLTGVVASLALFWMMQYMILSDKTEFNHSGKIKIVEFVRLKRETTQRLKERRLPEKPPAEKRPPPPKMNVMQTDKVQTDVPDIDMPNIDVPMQSERFKGSVISGLSVGQGNTQVSGEVIPLLRISPRYPMRAAMKRIEGWVKVEFTITENGGVKDAVVVDAQPKRVFDREALRAIVKWKFKPKLVDGRAIDRRAVQVLEFRLRR